MNLQSDNIIIPSTLNRKNHLQCCPVCGDIQDLIYYMGFWICQFCVSEEYKLEEESKDFFNIDDQLC